MQGLFPAISQYAEHQIPVDSPHSLYVEESGNPDGIPVLFIHGGPGAGCHPNHRRFFNPKLYRIILFDQRGCGRSTPHANLSNNTSQKLIQDIEIIRETLGIDSWLLFGGSWGSTLALLYAIEFPQRVKGLVLRGIFLARQEDQDWLYSAKGGAAQIFPDYYRDFVRPLGRELAQQDLLQSYYRLLTSDNEIERLAAAKAWSIWEGSISTLHCPQNAQEIYGDPHLALSMARIECHFFVNNSFIKENHILDNLHKITGLPAVVIHGRYDTVCKMENATSLVENWPKAQLQIVPEAGHSAMEPGIAHGLCIATSKMAEIVTKPKT